MQLSLLMNFIRIQCIRMGMTVPVEREEVNNVKREGKIKRTNSYRIVPRRFTLFIRILSWQSLLPDNS